jgi:hypothetical protein
MCFAEISLVVFFPLINIDKLVKNTLRVVLAVFGKRNGHHKQTKAPFMKQSKLIT